MKFKKICISLTVILILLSAAVVPFASGMVRVRQTNDNNSGGIIDSWENKAVKYEKPPIGEIAGDGAYPEEIKSSASAQAVEKQWYEYVTYSKNSIGTISVNSKTRVNLYDPYDYSYGMIMKIKDTNNLVFNGKNDLAPGVGIASQWSTANSQTVSYSQSKSSSVVDSDNTYDTTYVAIEAEAGFAFAKAKATTSFTHKHDILHTVTSESSASATVTQTFNALYFNSNGTPYNWRVVPYEVYLPLYCEIQEKINNTWVTTGYTYCLLTVLQGTCREWYNNVAYIEDWKTGAAITADEFWESFFDEKRLIMAYMNKLTPVQNAN